MRKGIPLVLFLLRTLPCAALWVLRSEKPLAELPVPWGLAKEVAMIQKTEGVMGEVQVEWTMGAESKLRA